MSLKLGDTAPNFDADSTLGKINFYDWLENSWGLLFSHPEDYTPVCTTELGMVANLSNEFAKRSVRTIALSIDNLESHMGWIKDIEDTIEGKIDFPIIADNNKKIAQLYGMIHSNTDANFTVRSVFIIGPDKKIKLTLTCPMAVGRNFDEILRVIDALQLSEEFDVVTPANWKKGEKLIIDPNLSNEQADLKFKNGYEIVKPYLRYVAQPN
ncbi:MAG: peroxiredoxin [Flavobacteriales bacterium]|nr:peroxiredoxin [Flavobacteriales bacterium]